MKATGVIRRIDELGRIVIPKEIRKNLRIKDGENIEILLENENVVLKKYSELSKVEEISEILIESMHSILKKDILIADSDLYTAIVGNYKNKLMGKQISNQLIEAIKNRVNGINNNNEKLYLTDAMEINCNCCLSTIIVNGDAVGIVIVLSEEEKISELDGKICQFVTHFLAKMLED